MHPNSLRNLRPGRKGEIRNPRGGNQWTADLKDAKALLDEL